MPGLFIIFSDQKHIHITSGDCMAFKTYLRKNLYNIITFIILFSLSFAHMVTNKFHTVSSDNAYVKMPILMYHGFTISQKTSDYVINIQDFENDIIYLKENGFSFINTQDLINYVYHNKTLPKKPVMITFDDGYLNNYTYAFPVIKKHNVKVVISPIAYYVEYYSLNNESDPLYTQLTTKEIYEMHKSGLADFQNHSYNMHSLDDRRGSSKKTNEKSEDYIREFYYDLKKAETVLKEITGIKPHAYTYPFGSYNEESLSVLKCSGYKITLSCREGTNYISKDKSSLYMLKRFNRTPQKSAMQILSQY